MKMNINILDATLDEAQALIDAEKNAYKVGAIEKAVNALTGTDESLEGVMRQIKEILLLGAGVV
jgi:hypothetical protein